MSRPGPAAPVTELRVEAYRFPTPDPESDGTLSWDATTAVVVHAQAGDRTGLGWTYSSQAAAAIVSGHLAGAVVGRDALDVPGSWEAMARACRNLGRPGIVSQAIAAVDIALWDLKARLLDVPLAGLFGRARDTVPVYGSGGFTSYDSAKLRTQVDGWLQLGCRGVKIKVAEAWGSNVSRDLDRTAAVRTQVGADVSVMVDANGGYTCGQAVRVGRAYDDLGVVWFEEPVSSDDVTQLALLRRQLRCDVAAGEYADSARYAEWMCAAGAVDCLQLDVTRCAGYSEWLRAAAVAAVHGLQVSGHCAPALHAPVAMSIPNLRHVEYFADHARLEPQLVDGVPPVVDGAMRLRDAPGHGMSIAKAASPFRVA